MAGNPFVRIDFVILKTCLNSIQFSSVTQLCPTLFDPMDCSTPGYPVHHQLPDLAQIHVHRVSNAIQPCHPLLAPSPPAFSLPQYQDLFQWISSSHQVVGALFSASVLPVNIQDGFPLGLTGLISLKSKGLSRVFSSTIIRKHLFCVQPSLWSTVPYLYTSTGKIIDLTILASRTPWTAWKRKLDTAEKYLKQERLSQIFGVLNNLQLSCKYQESHN